MNNHELKVSMLSGISLSLVAQFPLANILATALVAAVGALVSFVVGRLLQWLFKTK